jgi:predicted flap endonuclease-1-like 5' DNA nuclease
MPVKRKGKGLTRNRKVAKKVEKTTVVPSPTEELLLLPVEIEEECLPDQDLVVNDDTRTILEATSDECTTLNAQATRLAIAYCYFNVFGAPPPEQWDGRDGTTVQIRDFLKIPKNSGGRVRQILSQVHHCHCVGTRYTGVRNSDGGLGRKVIIKKTSVEAQIIADAVEDGMSMAMAHIIVNKHCYEADREPFSLSAVRTLILSLAPVVTPLIKLKQGDTDPTSAWSRARYNWVLQLLIRFGLFVYLGTPPSPPSPSREETEANISSSNLDPISVTTTTTTTAIPDCFNAQKMASLSMYQIVWWDESHQVCKLATDGNGKKTQVRFRRDPAGKLDPSGTLKDPHKELRVKYEKEVRLGLGCAATKCKDTDEIVGKRCKAFCYSGKVVLSIKDYKDKQKAELKRVKLLKGNNFWVIDRRQKGEFYEDDTISFIPGIGVKMKERLEAEGIFTVRTLADLSDDSINHLTARPDFKLSKKVLEKFRDSAKNSKGGNQPDDLILDHRQAENPYLSLYGEDEWEDKIKGSVTLAAYISIADMIEFMVGESQRVMEGTHHEDDWFFYHDALSLMTAKETIQWMREKDYLKRWLLPINQLSEDDKDLKNFLHRPIGNSPEMMPWDCSLNKDIKDAVMRHVCYTCHLPEDDVRKFSLSTPKRGSWAFRRILEHEDGSPSSQRILQDIAKVFNSMEKIRQAKGALIAGIGDRKGRRALQQHASGINVRGGKRVREKEKDKVHWIHPDARSAYALKLENSKAVHAGQNIEKENLNSDAPFVDDEDEDCL